MGGFLIFISMVTGTAAFISLIRPLPRFWLPTRKRAAIVWIASFVLFGIGGELLPEPTPEEARAQAEMEAERVRSRAAAEQAEKEARTVTISADDLIMEYKTNPLRADKKYENMEMHVFGRVNDIGKDIMGTPYLTFGSGFQNVRAEIDDERSLLSISSGQAIQIICEEVSEGVLGDVQLSDCSFSP